MAIAYLISYHLIRSINNFTIPSSSLLNIFLASAVIWYINGRVFQLYNEITFISYSQELVSLLKASILHLLFLTFVLFLLYDNIDLFRAFIFLYNFSLFFLLVLQKYIYRLYQGGIIKKSKPLKKVLVIGPEIYKTHVFRSMLSNNSLDFIIVGALFNEDNHDNIKDYLGKISELEKVLI
jgi:FlaA1/EpsC-like NDP-sugar epimerase